MIIDLARLKTKLGIDPADTASDEDLTTLIEEQTAWVEGETHRRFDAPMLRTETIKGRGDTTLWLGGHIELNDGTHPEYGTVVVIERIQYADDAELAADTDFEARCEQSFASLVRLDGYAWSRNAEYDVTYYDGYSVAPKDIQALLYDLVVTEYRMDQATADASAGITSESLVGVYSYSIDREHATTESSGALSNISQKTIERWKRHF